MPPRKSTSIPEPSEQTIAVTRSRSRTMTRTNFPIAKRKHDPDDATEAVDKNPYRSSKRVRIKAAAASANASVIDLTGPSPYSQSAPKKRKKTSGGSPAVQKEEKRLRVFRKWAPQSYLLKLERARTQRLFVLGRQRVDTGDAPQETFDVVGSTGNVYKVHIGKVPFCSCPDSKKGNQCKHIVYVNINGSKVLHNVLKAPSHLQYQLAFLSAELHEIFQKAPASPMESASKENNEGKRKEIDGDCPICFMEFDPNNEEIVWCKAACGNNIHKACFQQWVASERGKTVRCVYCRTPWQGDKPSNHEIIEKGRLNDEGYLNVGGAMGLPEERDVSTYHQPWRQRGYGYGYYGY